MSDDIDQDNIADEWAAALEQQERDEQAQSQAKAMAFEELKTKAKALRDGPN